MQGTNYILSPATVAVSPVMDGPCQLSLAVLAGGWANGPPLELMPLSQAVAAATDLHGDSSDLAAWRQVTTARAPEDLRQVVGNTGKGTLGTRG